jgi:hypothetical protein
MALMTNDDQADSSLANQAKRFEAGTDDKQNGDKRQQHGNDDFRLQRLNPLFARLYYQRMRNRGKKNKKIRKLTHFLKCDAAVLRFAEEEKIFGLSELQCAQHLRRRIDAFFDELFLLKPFSSSLLQFSH